MTPETIIFLAWIDIILGNYSNELAKFPRFCHGELQIQRFFESILKVTNKVLNTVLQFKAT